MTMIRIGTSGWSYPHWRGKFYPEKWPHKKELDYASRCFNSVEINGSFYSLLKPDTYRRYYDQTPAGFLFAVKGSRFITHNKKLKDAEIPLANFFGSGVLRLADKLGPFLWQLPPRAIELDRLDHFLGLLPDDTEAAVRLASKHDRRIEGRSWLATDARRPLRHAIELRDPSHFIPECVNLARRHRMAIVFSDSGSWPYTEELTADFVYLRLHGSPHTYASAYDPGALDRWARRVRRWQAGSEPEQPRRITGLSPPAGGKRDVYIFFDNDYEAYAPRDAASLMERLGVAPLS